MDDDPCHRATLRGRGAGRVVSLQGDVPVIREKATSFAKASKNALKLAGFLPGNTFCNRPQGVNIRSLHSASALALDAADMGALRWMFSLSRRGVRPS